MKHHARHPLPISNGWSQSGDQTPVVYCGLCKDVFEVDAAWAVRYATAHGPGSLPLPRRTATPA